MRKIYRPELGNILIQSDRKDIVKCEPIDHFVEEGMDEIIEKCMSYLDNYFSGKTTGKPENIRIKELDYSTKILKLVCEIPYGAIATYTDIEERYEKIYNTKTPARTVERAIGLNDLMILVPCHRAIGKNNKLTGYKSGIDKKKSMLNLEKSAKNL